MAAPKKIDLRIIKGCFVEGKKIIPGKGGTVIKGLPVGPALDLLANGQAVRLVKMPADDKPKAKV